MKTCLKHSRKCDISQVISEVDHWDIFLHEIKTFNQSESLVGYISILTSFCSNSNLQSAKNQNKHIDIFYTFDLDQLPVSFGQSLETSSEGITDFSPLNQPAGQLIEIIHEAGGYKFRLSYIRKESKFIYYYYCCQDSSRWLKPTGIGNRDRRQME